MVWEDVFLPIFRLGGHIWKHPGRPTLMRLANKKRGDTDKN